MNVNAFSVRLPLVLVSNVHRFIRVLSEAAHILLSPHSEAKIILKEKQTKHDNDWKIIRLPLHKYISAHKRTSRSNKGQIKKKSGKRTHAAADEGYYGELITGKMSFLRRVRLQTHGFAASPRCPYFQVAKAHFEDFAGMTETAPIPIFCISYTAHWRAASASVMAWHIYERRTEELGRYAQVLHFESLQAKL